MAQLQLPILPLRLYRYRSLTRKTDRDDVDAVDQEIASIREHSIHCSDFKCMNDPMEGFFTSSPSFRAERSYTEAVERIRYSKLEIGLACFSETYESVLMWAHYAGNFSGMCLEYSTEDLLAGLPRDAALVRLSYIDEEPTISVRHARNSSDAAVHILSQKKGDWAYEREWRVLARKGLISAGPIQPITAIYLGARISNQHRHRILSRIQGTGIKAYRMELNGYRHKFTAINAEAKRKKESGDELRVETEEQE